MSPGVAPTVSVIVTTKNEDRNIGACLESVVQQSMAPLEVIADAASRRHEDLPAGCLNPSYDACHGCR